MAHVLKSFPIPNPLELAPHFALLFLPRPPSPRERSKNARSFLIFFWGGGVFFSLLIYIPRGRGLYEKR